MKLAMPGGQESAVHENSILCRLQRGLAGSLDMARLHLFALSQVLRAHYDVVQRRDRIFVSVLCGLASCLRGTPFVYWMSFPIEDGYLYTAGQFAERDKFLQALPRWLLGHLGHFLLYRLTLRFAQHFFVQSDYMKNSVAQRSIPLEKLTAVPMGVDVEAFNADSVMPESHHSTTANALFSIQVRCMRGGRRL
jgi:hypothetical protein